MHDRRQPRWSRLTGLFITSLLTAPLPVTTALAADRTDGSNPFDASLPQISWDQTRDHVGEHCVVYGTVVAAKDIGSRCFLNFHANYREHFTVVIESQNYDKFSAPPDKLFTGKHVRVSGKIIEYQGKPEIIATGPDTIEVTAQRSAGAAATPTTAAAVERQPLPQTFPRLPATGPWQPPAGGVITLATFNVLNLFDANDDPYVPDELSRKPPSECARLARTIRTLNADVIALQEVESRPALTAFLAEHLSDQGYREVVLFEGNSERGIDVAVVSRLPVGAVTSHRHCTFDDSNGKTMRFQRDVPQVRITPPGFESFDVFVVHLKSKRGGPQVALPIRLGEARMIRGLLDGMLADDPQARFVICGDFNDEFTSTPLQALIGSGNTALHGFLDDLPAGEHLTLKRWNSMVDFLFASPAMADGYVGGSYQIHADPGNTNGSDHLPVSARFRLTRAGVSSAR